MWFKKISAFVLAMIMLIVSVPFSCVTSFASQTDIISSKEEKYYNITVIYDVNTGVGTYDNLFKTINAYSETYYDFTLSTVEPTKTGYSFNGWSTVKNNNSNLIGAGDVLRVYPSNDSPYFFQDETVTVYAYWTPKQYTVNLDKNGGTIGLEPITVTFDANMPDVEVPKRLGYKFVGYFDDPTGGKQYYDKDGKSTATWDKDVDNSSLYAHWTANTTTVFLEQEGGTGGTETVKATFGSPMPEATMPTRFGYNFMGYFGSSTGGDEQIYYNADGTSARDWNMTSPYFSIYAHWDPLKYKITYNLDGGVNNSENPSYYTIESGDLTIKRPTRIGYTFTGWTDKETSKTEMDPVIPEGYSKEKTYTANWKVIIQTVTFDKNGGNGGTNSITITYDSALPAITAPTRTNYKFDGYYDQDGKKYYNADGTSALKWDKGESTTLYAHWTIDEYTITYNLNGGSLLYNQTNPTTYTHLTETFTLYAPVKKGYTFLGWTGSNGTTPQTNVTITKGSVGNRTYTANWKANSNTMYVVNHYTQNLGKDSFSLYFCDEKEGTTNTTFTLESQKIAITGFTYKEGKINSNIATSATVLPDGSLEIDLYYTRNSYTLTLKKGEGVLNVEGAGTYQYGQGITINAALAEGYQWSKWSGEADVLRQAYTFAMPAKDTTYTATAELINYLINYNLNGGTLIKPNPVRYNMKSADITLNAPTKTGYTFLGWTGSNGSTPQKTVTIKSGSTGNKEYTANFKINEYTIKFNSDGGSDVQSITQEYGTKITRPADPTKDGSIFMGWSPDVPTTMPAYDLTCVAQWKTIEVEINYVHKYFSFISDTYVRMKEAPNLNGLPTKVVRGTSVNLSGKETTKDGKTIYRAPTCDGYIFIGFYKDEGFFFPAYQNDEDITVTNDTTLYAKWIPLGEFKLSSDDKYIRADEANKTTSNRKSGLDFYGAQLKLTEDSNGKGLRFVTRVRTDLLQEINKASGKSNNVSYGYMIAKQETFANEYNSDPLQMPELEANANKYAEFDKYFIYSGLITYKDGKNYGSNVSVTPYIKYTDANNIERKYCYTEKAKADNEDVAYNGVYHTTLKNIAKAYLRVPCVEYTAEQQNYLNSIINYKE